MSRGYTPQITHILNVDILIFAYILVYMRLENMIYTFPTINTIHDVAPLIENIDGIITIKVRGNLDLIDYVIMTDAMFESDNEHQKSIAKECRGLVFDQSGTIIRRAFHKFFNLNQTDDVHEDNIPRPFEFDVFEKLDGSMIAPFIHDDEVIWGTRKASETHHQRVKKFIEQQTTDWDKIARDYIARGITPIFEFTAPDNRIVVKYDDESLTLLDARYMVTGEYVGTSDDVPSVNLLSQNNFNFIKDVRDWHVDDHDKIKEGVVVKFPNGHRLKVKSEQYSRFHYARTSLTEKVLIRAICDGHIDDIKAALVDEDREIVTEYENTFMKGVNAYARKMVALSTLMSARYTRKQFANEIASTLTKLETQWVYMFWNDCSFRNAQEKIILYINNNSGTSHKRDSVRHIFKSTFKPLSFLDQAKAKEDEHDRD